MSDTFTTPTVDAPPPPPTEVTIPEQGSPGGSGEVGEQTPRKSLEQQSIERAVARRESIERAFQKSKDATAEKKAATEPKEEGKSPGEERGKPEQKAQHKSDNRDTQKLQQQQRNRGEGGRFAPAQSAEGATEAGRPVATPSKYAPLAETAPYREAPPRLSDAAKAEWHGTPESVRAATTQAFEQYEKGIQQYRQVAEAFQPLAHYHQQAQQDGTNLRTVLDNYVGMEQKLRGDLFGGLELIVHNLNMAHPDGRRVNAYDVCAAYLQQSPEQRRLTQQNNNAQSQHAILQQMRQEQQKLATSLHQMQYQQRFTWTRAQIDAFANSHPGFDERSDLIKQELNHGYPLDVAYDRAMKLRPGNGSTQAAQTRNTSAQTRDEIDRSISGAPSNGAAASYRAPKKSGSNGEALRNALRRVRSGV
jgi:hypothetical protein